MVFKLAAGLALRHSGPVSIDNEYERVRSAVGDLDPKRRQRQRLGWTVLRAGARRVILANDGRVLQPLRAESLWTRCMRGETEYALLRWLEEALGLAVQGSGG